VAALHTRRAALSTLHSGTLDLLGRHAAEDVGAHAALTACNKNLGKQVCIWSIECRPSRREVLPGVALILGAHRGWLASSSPMRVGAELCGS
jgi:hypothetical protein